MDAALGEQAATRVQSAELPGATGDLSRQKSASVSGFDDTGIEQGSSQDAASMSTAAADLVIESAHAGRLHICVK